MRKFVSAICATALTATLAITGAVQVSAAPGYFVGAETVPQRSDVVRVHDWRWKNGRSKGRSVWRVPEERGSVRISRIRPQYGWHNGYRGYRYKRPGHRYHDGWWFPAGAFIAGAIIGSAIANSNNPPAYRYRGGNAHVDWCYSRYRSYREYDNTFQPYNGPRRQCISPYG